MTVFPCDQPTPTASNVDYVADQNVANLATMKIGADGMVCFYAFEITHIVAAVAG